MNAPATVSEPLSGLDGFRVEVDETRERADIVLARPPMNTVSMAQRDQLRRAFEALDSGAAGPDGMPDDVADADEDAPLSPGGWDPLARDDRG